MTAENEGRSAPEPPAPRIRREKRVVETMTAMYCRDHHGGGAERCADCTMLRDYAMARLDHCVFGAEKPVCAQCPVHCRKPALREQIRTVMRYAGPRMLREHLIMALRHIIDGRRKAPSKNGRRIGRWGPLLIGRKRGLAAPVAPHMLP